MYGWHREVYGIWLEKLKEFNPVMFTGSESPIQKELNKQKFLKGESKVMSQWYDLNNVMVKFGGTLPNQTANFFPPDMNMHGQTMLSQS